MRLLEGILKVSIKGLDYTVQLLDKNKFEKVHGKDLAYLDKTKRQFCFRKDHVEKTTVIHEVTHAFINSLHLGSCNELTLEDFEEIICEMLEDHLLDISRISNQIYRHLRSFNVRRRKGRK